MKTNALKGAALDWAVAKCEGRKMQRNPMGPQSGHGWWIWEETPSGLGGIILSKSIYMEIGPRIRPKTRQSREKFSPSSNWAQGGPIIERERICIDIDSAGVWLSWIKQNYEDEPRYMVSGTTPLIAAMRCYVASKLGDNVELPEELK